MLLDLGHTLGHSIEHYMNFTGISHVRAVAVGMVKMTKLAEKMICVKKNCGSSHPVKTYVHEFTSFISRP